MAQNSDQYNFYKVLSVQSNAQEPDIQKAYEEATASLRPEDMPAEERKAAILALVAADAAKLVLLDSKKRSLFDARLNEVRKIQTEKEKIEAKRAGKLQEQQSIEEDEKLKNVSLQLDAANAALSDFYYDQLFAAAKTRKFESVPPDNVMEWISSQRADLLRKAEQKGRRVSFRIDWRGFPAIQEMRKKRGEEIDAIVDQLVKDCCIW
ncbi:MAG: hypothetical protein C4520_11555 [Candidatus Abyssobacteria bacterium SURF_5]|uniref:J domain-containing protein n=1 Tax=Abyssobacteria bacterium (strain SURF_5) TaxID=2093360 RepID=A0A3A4NIJ1_ABYX5|nr:MAG: hypothetical protein C4520_11555 [Candidatus Abyssubacteria bacterium SURF_5]